MNIFSIKFVLFFYKEFLFCLTFIYFLNVLNFNFTFLNSQNMYLLVEFYTATSIFYVLNIVLDLAVLITNIKK